MLESRPDQSQQVRPSHRRPFRVAFSLRSVFVLLTILAMWLAWQRRIVEERQALIAEIEATFEAQAELLDEVEVLDARQTPQFPYALGYQEGVFTHDMNLGDIAYTRISWIRRLLGDDAYLTINISESSSPQFIARVERAFPESRLFLRHADELLQHEFRDALYRPAHLREPNIGTTFSTGLKQQ